MPQTHNHTKRQLQLLGTTGCHLCDHAEQVLAGHIDFTLTAVELVDIANSDALLERYATQIPVLRCLATQTQLNWPFDAAALHVFLEQH